MRVVPVIDLKQGVVVRGVGGRRDEYRPIESRICPSAHPGDVAQSLAGLGFREVYVADLDAIESGHRGAAWSPALPIYAELLGAGLEPWVDAGVSSVAQARELAAFASDGQRLAAVVAGLESLAAPAVLADISAAIPRERLIFSLDLKQGQPLTTAPAWQSLTPEAIAAIALRSGVRRMIVLDLARVGMGAGVGTEPLCRTLRALDPELEIIAGGGVRSPRDLDALARTGCDAALVASALHDGRLTPVASVGPGPRP